MIITSRPYACHTTNVDFLAHHYKICPLDHTQIQPFVEIYCKTSNGRKKVIDYVATKGELLIPVPLIVTFLCYLADTEEEIPDNITLLYELLIWHMLKREIYEEKLSEKVNLQEWKFSNVVKSTAKLAYLGCKTNRLQFNASDIAQCKITDDNFTCGFLLSWNDSCLKVEFPHRSLLMEVLSNNENTDKDQIVKLLLQDDSQLGRYLFGNCSLNQCFARLFNWHTFTFGDAKRHGYSFAHFLRNMSNCSLDASETEAYRLGQMLAMSINEVEIQTERPPGVFLAHLRSSFAEGLGLKFFTKNSDRSWYIHVAKKENHIAVAHVFPTIHIDVWKDFIQVEHLIWTSNIPDVSILADSLTSLPPVKALAIHLKDDCDVEINWSLEHKGSSSATNLENFFVAFDRGKIYSSLQRVFGKCSSTFLSVKKLGKSENGDRTVIEISATVFHTKQVKQATIVKALIKQSSEIISNERFDAAQRSGEKKLKAVALTSQVNMVNIIKPSN